MSEETGRVRFDGTQISKEEIVEEIKDMGFEAELSWREEEDDTDQQGPGDKLLPSTPNNEDTSINIEDLLGEPPDCVCGDDLLQLGVEGKFFF